MSKAGICINLEVHNLLPVSEDEQVAQTQLNRGGEARRSLFPSWGAFAG